jgi:hypothetical protein
LRIELTIGAVIAETSVPSPHPPHPLRPQDRIVPLGLAFHHIFHHQRIEFGYTTAGGYRLRVATLNNSTTWTTGAWVNIADAPHVIELDWQSSTNGSLNWWIDEVQQTALTNVDNSARRIDRAARTTSTPSSYASARPLTR